MRMKKSFKTVICTVLVMFFVTTSGVWGGDKTQQDWTKSIDAYLTKAYPPGAPGVTVLAMKGDTVVFRNAYGSANLELNVPLRPEMVFRIGSLTKQFTAVAIMMLVEEKKISLDDEITRFLSDYPTNGHRITVTHLLNHTSGIKSMTGMPKWLPVVRNDMSTKEMVDFFKNEPMDFPPGEKFKYNNSGYYLLGVIIEKVTGKTYETVINERIFKPLGMKNSYYGNHHRIVPNRASGYKPGNSGYLNADFLSMTQPYSAGALISSVDDFKIWEMAIREGKLLSQKSWEQLFTPLKLNDGKPLDYAFGWIVSKFWGHRMIAHGGGIFGFSTFALRIPEEKIFVAVFSNCPGQPPGSGNVAQRIAGLLLGKNTLDMKAIKVEPKILEAYAGVYQIDKDKTRTVIVEGDRLFTQRNNGRKFEAFARSKTEFFYKETLSSFTFVKDKNGNVVKMIMSRPSGDEEAVKVKK